MCNVYLQVTINWAAEDSQISRQYSQFVIATMQFVKCITLFAVPGVYALFVHDTSKQEEWRYVFFLMSGLLAIVRSKRL